MKVARYRTVLMAVAIASCAWTASTFQISRPLSQRSQYHKAENHRLASKIVSHAVSDAEARAQAAMESEQSGPEEAMSIDQNVFPLSKVVGQENIKSALLLGAINQRMGGVAISGGRGTAKSVMARALHRIMPPIERVKDSDFNIDPESIGEIDTFLRDRLNQEGKSLADLETEVIPCPFVQVPLNVMEDRLLGSVNVEQSVKQGKTVFEPGLLAKAHRGVLYVDDINLLDTELANILLGVISEGWVNVEREGISVRYPCRPLLVATFNPEEADLRDHLLDRLSVALSVDAKPLTLEQRLEAVDEVLAFGDINTKPDELQAILDDEDQLRTRIIFARESLKETLLSRDQKLYLAEEAARAGCQGHRGEIFACEIARASAALNDRVVDADDLRLAVKLAILPRGTFINDPDMMDDMIPPPPPPPPQQQDFDEDEDTEEQQDPEENEEDQEDEDKEEEAESPQIPQEFMFDAEGTPIDPELLEFAKKQKAGKGGGRGLIFSEDRGRYIKPMLPRGRVTRLAVDATMRAAAPYQRARRTRNEEAEKKQDRRVFIENSDVRVKRMARKAGSLIIFVCDASGSMALNRMNAAKGAAMSLLTEAYQSRDKVCIIPFQGDLAEVLLPPTRSIAMARRRLETMPCGGGSPLAHALNVAVRTGLNAQKSGDVGKVVVICISDGRANVPLAYATDNGNIEEREKPDKAELKEEVLNAAKQLGAVPGFNLVVLDTENKFVSTGMAKEIANAANGKYHYIPKAGEAAISQITAEALADAKS